MNAGGCCRSLEGIESLSNVMDVHSVTNSQGRVVRLFVAALYVAEHVADQFTVVVGMMGSERGLPSGRGVLARKHQHCHVRGGVSHVTLYSACKE